MTIIETISEPTRYILPGIIVDLLGHTVTDGERTAYLTVIEDKVLSALLKNYGKRVTTERLNYFVYDGSREQENVWVSVSRLRKKLLIFPRSQEWIINCDGTGYIFFVGGAL